MYELIGWMTLVMKCLKLKHILTHVILVVPEKQFSYLKNCSIKMKFCLNIMIYFI